MPAGKKYQSSAMLYTVVTFVALFIIAAAVAVVYYIKAEEYRTKTVSLQGQIDDMATSQQLRNIGTLVGERQRRQTRLGTMLDYLDTTISTITGGVPEETSAQVKVETTKRQARELLETLSPKYLNLNTDDPNTTGLVRVVAKLKTILDNAVEQADDKQQQNQELQKRFDDTVAANIEKEKTLLAEKEKYQQEVNSIKTDYADLKTLMEQTSEQQVQTLATQLDIQKTTNKRLNQDMLKTQAELKIAENRIKHIQQKFQALVPPPDVEVAAFKADGKVILIDPQANIVHLNLGRQDRIYQGLTFSVYEKNMPIPKDGKGKAEVEVFNVGESISAARIIRSEISRPIVLDDIIANLIWDADKANIFVVAGDFDLDSDKSPDYNGPEKIATLVERWGGVVKKDVSIDTDFLILGELPDIPRKPTFEQLEVDPMAMDKYDALIERLTRYRQVKKQADTLSIPIFNTERFLYFAGYREQAKRPGAF